ncbi:MAG: tetratricopeptide repeat protein [Alphaproteobacteria bacterium]|nr:tetratricopeptide repeat protein [Alphaproteobacteria bacterium]
MTLKDSLGLTVATDAKETVAAIDRFRDQFLGYGKDLPCILKGVEADPTSVLANAIAAALFLFLESRDGPGRAAPYLRTADDNVGRATERERQFLAGIGAWHDGDGDRAFGRLFDLVRRWPHDLTAAKIAQYHAFNRGESERILAVADAILPANRDLPYVHGMRAFGLEQCHRLAEAEDSARQAVAMNRRDPWAHHAVAHVMETQGRVDEGIAWMSGLAPTWDDCNSFMYTHNWWHLALFHLDRDEHARVTEIYDRHVWGIDKTYSQDQIGAVSMLWRMELRGIDVGTRWQDLADHIEARVGEHVFAFLDLQYLYALLRSGRPSGAAMAASLERKAEQAGGAWRQVALPMAQGIVDFAGGRFERAFAVMTPAIARLQDIGGSHAQRDLFVQTWLAAALKGGQAAAVRSVLEERHRARPKVAVAHRMLHQGRISP